MKRTLIAIASVGVLVPAAWMVEANAQQMAPVSPPSQAYAPSQMASTQAYAQHEEPVAMRVARLPPLLPRLPLLLPVGLSTALAPVRHPMPSTSLAKDTH